MKEDLLYKQHRIHTARLPSNRYISSIVNMGKKKALTEDSLTDAVTRVPGEFESEDFAIQAAKDYIDRVGQEAGG